MLTLRAKNLTRLFRNKFDFMNEFIIHLPVDSYVSNDFGEFCVQLGDYYFPSKVWTDFGERVIFSWSDELTELFLGKSKIVHCKFMDGNYRLDVATTNSKEALNISFIRDAGQIDNVKHQGNVDFQQLSREVLRVIKEIQDECRKSKNYEAVDRIEASIEKFVEAKNLFTQ